MSKIPPGIYNIRFTPTNIPPPTGGLFITSEGIGKQLAIRESKPQFEQRWSIVPVEGPDPDTYAILLDSKVAPRFGWNFGGGPTHHVSIIVRPDPRNWIIRPIDSESSIYNIIQTPEISGAIEAVAPDGDLVFVIGFGEKFRLATWEIIPADLKHERTPHDGHNPL